MKHEEEKGIQDHPMICLLVDLCRIDSSLIDSSSFLTFSCHIF
jgi:hypothetical protein